MDTSDSARPTAAAVGSTFGVLVFIGCGVAAVWYVKKRRNKSEVTSCQIGNDDVLSHGHEREDAAANGSCHHSDRFQNPKAELETPPAGRRRQQLPVQGYIPVESNRLNKTQVAAKLPTCPRVYSSSFLSCSFPASSSSP